MIILKEKPFQTIFLYFSMCLILVSCIRQNSKQGRNKTKVDENNTVSFANLSDRAENLQLQLNDTQHNIKILQVQNATICEKIQQYRSRCFSATKLTPDATFNTDCNGQPILPKEPVYSVEISGLSANQNKNLRLKVNDSFTSEAFPLTNGSHTIKFNAPLNSTGVRSPKIMEIHKLALQSAIPGETIDFNSFELVVKVVPDPDTGTTYTMSINQIPKPESAEVVDVQLNIQNIVANMTGPNCQISNRSLNSLLHNIAQNVSVDTTTDTHTELTNRTNTGLQSAVTTLMQELANAQTAIQTIGSHKQVLIDELTINRDIGCHLNRPITDFKIKLQGSIETNREYISESSEKQSHPHDTGPSDQLNFDFGGIKFSLRASEHHGFFNGEYQHQVDLTKNPIIASIDRIVIGNAAVKYDNTPMPCSGQGGIIGKVDTFFTGGDTCYKITEQYVFHINSIKITANNIDIYEESGLSLTLDRKKQRVFKYELRNNEKWINLVERTDCNIVD